MSDDTSRMTEKVKPPEAVVAALRGSGFPFQTAVAYAVEGAPGGWRVHATEYPWESMTGESHFLDLVATNGTVYLTVECKKTRKETLTFLRPLGLKNTGLVQDFRCLRVRQMDGSTRRIYCENWGLYPRSNISEFCVIGTSTTGKDHRLLERDAGLLVGASEALAFDLRAQAPQLPSACLVVPVIVTNAPIFSARYRPSAVSLETGEFTSIPDDVTKPECVRFQKGFALDSSRDLGDRTVFVVNALSLIDFLSSFDIAPQEHQPTDRAPVMLQRRDVHGRILG